MFLGTQFVQLLPRNATIDEAKHAPMLAENPAAGCVGYRLAR